jgi:hypothetical protein
MPRNCSSIAEQALDIVATRTGNNSEEKKGLYDYTAGLNPV